MVAQPASLLDGGRVLPLDSCRWAKDNLSVEDFNSVEKYANVKESNADGPTQQVQE